MASEEGVSTVTKTSEKFNNGIKTVVRWDIIRRFSTMSKPKKLLFGGYLATVMVSFCTFTYNDGKESLIKHRKKVPIISHEEEWLSVKNGCSENVWDNFWSSVFFPATCVTNVVPSLVMWLNGTKKN